MGGCKKVAQAALAADANLGPSRRWGRMRAKRGNFEALLPGHPALQRAVREWQERLIPLTGASPTGQPTGPVVYDGKLEL